MDEKKRKGWIPGTIVFVAGVGITLAATFTGAPYIQVLVLILCGLPFMGMGVWIILRSFTPRRKG